MTNTNNTTLYTGMTNNLRRRMYEHKIKHGSHFTKKYNLEKLIYYEVFDNPESVILREKQIKAGSRKKKENLINDFNSDWKDLYIELS